MKEKIEIEKIIESKKKELSVINHKIHLIAKNRISFLGINKNSVKNYHECSNSTIYFYYKERERVIAEINILFWMLENNNNIKYSFDNAAFQEFELLNNTSEVVYIKTFGGLGDCLMLTPALRSIKTFFNDRKIVVYCSQTTHFEILKGNPFIYYYADDSFYEKNIDKFYAPDVYNILPSLIYPKKISKIICHLLNTIEVEDKLDLFLSQEEIEFGKEFKSNYCPFICINPTSKCSKNQEWPEHKWVQLVEKAKTKGFNIVQVGLKEENLIKDCIDLREKFTLRESLSVLNSSIGFIGVDSFWSHAASALNVPAIVLFGDSTPEIWGHENNINIYKKYDCSPCFELLYGQTCPYNKKCMNDIEVNEVLSNFNIFNFVNT